MVHRVLALLTVVGGVAAVAAMLTSAGTGAWPRHAGGTPESDRWTTWVRQGVELLSAIR